MAFASTSIWEVRSGGSDTANGGAFDPARTTFATDLAATDGNTAAPVVSSASYTFTADDVGHWVYVQSGTNWTPGWYKIASVAGGAATLDADVGGTVMSSVNVPWKVNTVAGIATVASPSGGVWSMDFSQTDAVREAYTDLVIDEVPAPAAPTAAPGGNGTMTLGTYGIKITYLTAGGEETEASANTDVTLVSSSADSITVTSPAAQYGATHYKVWMTTAGGATYRLQNTSSGTQIGTNYSRTTNPATSGGDPPATNNTQVLLTSAARPFTKTDVGNMLAVTAGTDFTVQRLQILDVQSNVALVDKDAGVDAATGGTAGLGGGLASPGMAGGLLVDSNLIWIQSGTYTLSSTANVSGGRIRVGVSGTSVIPIVIAGYTSLRTDRSTRPSLRPGANSVTCLTLSNAGTGGDRVNISNLEVNNAGAFSTTTGISCFGMVGATVDGCQGFDLDSAFNAEQSTDVTFSHCLADGCSKGFLSQASSVAIVMRYCVAKDSTTQGFYSNVTSQMLLHCCIDANSLDGILFTTTGSSAVNCISYNCGNATTDRAFALDVSGAAISPTLINCIAVGCAGSGFAFSETNSNRGAILINCAGYDNAEGDTKFINDVCLQNFITLTADPFVDAASGDFRLNDAAGGGALLKGQGFPQTFPGLAAANYPDIGAYQSESTAVGGGLVAPIISGIGGGLIIRAG